MEESAEPSPRPDPAVAPERAVVERDRLEALEQQVRQLTSRLAGWVEAQLVQALEDRRNDMKALRSELQVVVAEQLAGLRAEQTSMLTVASRRFDVAQEQLAERLDAVVARTSETPVPPGTDPERLAALEEQVATRLAQLHDQVEARISASAERQRADLDALRTELLAARDDGPRRTDGLEQRVRSAMSRLSESVESKLAEVGTARQGELDGLRTEATKALGQQASELRTEIANTATALRARFSEAQERVDALERQYGEAEAHLGQLVETKLSEIVDRRRVELDQLKWELQEDLAKQLSEARSQIGTTVADAHRRFLLSVERLDERMAGVSEESAGLADKLEAVHEAVLSDGRRIEALELHTRRTDERLTDLVEGKLAELAGERIAELEEFRGQLRTALDNHLADTRVEVSMTTGAAREELGKTRAELVDARRELTEGAARLREHQAALDREVSQAIARLESLGVSVQDRLREAEARTAGAAAERQAALDREVSEVVAGLESFRIAAQDRLREAEARAAAAVASRLAELEPVAGQVTEYRAEVAGLAEQFQAVAAATAKAAFAEAGMLAPMRSDLQRLQEQVAALTEAVAELRPRRKAAAVKAGGPVLPAVRRVPAPAREKAAAPAKKAAGPRRPKAQ